MNFRELGIEDLLIKALKEERITEPTKVQEEAYKTIRNRKNLMVQSQTGTGKTLAYLIPVFMDNWTQIRGMTTLILVPTHELAMQVHRQVQSLSSKGNIQIKSTPIVGNVNIKRQVEALKEKPQIIIGTAGRILELIKLKKITAHTMKQIIIDEADKLLDKDNFELTKSVVKCCMRDTQVLFFSASIPQATQTRGQEIREDLEVLKLTEKLEIPKNIQHIYFVVERREKIEMLRKLAKSINPEKAMVFVNRAFDLEEAVQKLKYHHYSCEALHGTNKKMDRKKVVQDFQTGSLQFLIASDIAARGLHFEKVSTVFHITIPEEPKDYLHRAGRAGRGQEKGLSVLIITKEELGLIKEYQKAFGINILAKNLYQGKIVKS